LNKIKHFVHAYSEWIKHALAPLGPWGMLAFAAVDGSFLGMPLDAIFVGYVYNDRSRFLMYVLLASAGSALGSVVIYVIGYTGGEVLLRKRMSPAPFKIVVLAAAAFEMNFAHFLLAIFAGRFVRFLIEALLTLRFGPQIVVLTGNLFAHHFVGIIAGVGVVVAGWLVWRRVKRGRAAIGLDGAEPRHHTS
jgi:membrane protein YqaA with SNARE-associated domain